MKKLFTLLMGLSILFLSSCGGGWTDEQKTQIKNKCITTGSYDCDCYVKNAVKTFKNPEEYNDKSSEKYKKFEKKIEDCKVEKEQPEEELQSF